jgi:hypothetical protein
MQINSSWIGSTIINSVFIMYMKKIQVAPRIANSTRPCDIVHSWVPTPPSPITTIFIATVSNSGRLYYKVLLQNDWESLLGLNNSNRKKVQKHSHQFQMSMEFHHIQWHFIHVLTYRLVTAVVLPLVTRLTESIHFQPMFVHFDFCTFLINS